MATAEGSVVGVETFDELTVPSLFYASVKRHGSKVAIEDLNEGVITYDMLAHAVSDGATRLQNAIQLTRRMKNEEGGENEDEKRKDSARELGEGEVHDVQRQEVTRRRREVAIVLCVSSGPAMVALMMALSCIPHVLFLPVEFVPTATHTHERLRFVVDDSKAAFGE